MAVARPAHGVSHKWNTQTKKVMSELNMMTQESSSPKTVASLQTINLPWLQKKRIRADCRFNFQTSHNGRSKALVRTKQELECNESALHSGPLRFLGVVKPPVVEDDTSKYTAHHDDLYLMDGQ